MFSTFILQQKLDARERSLRDTSQLTLAQKSKYSHVLTMEFMSSEYSQSDDEHGDIFVIKKLPWRSQEVNKVFDALHGRHLSWLSLKAKRMETEPFDSNEPSERQLPKQFPRWAVRDQYQPATTEWSVPKLEQHYSIIIAVIVLKYMIK